MDTKMIVHKMMSKWDLTMSKTNSKKQDLTMSKWDLIVSKWEFLYVKEI